MDIGKHKLVEEARTWVLAMNVSQAMISSKDTQSALEAIWNKIDEKKQNQPYHKTPAFEKGGLEGWQ
jgi:molybdopterin synthase catalytic subunit